MHLPLILAEAPAACCCAHRDGDAECACPMCAHRREAQSGKPVLKTCGPGTMAAVIAGPQIALPAAVSPSIECPAPAPIQIGVDSSPPDPTLDVPTPPPLARA
jgi:hypothetical protein